MPPVPVPELLEEEEAPPLPPVADVSDPPQPAAMAAPVKSPSAKKIFERDFVMLNTRHIIMPNKK